MDKNPDCLFCKIIAKEIPAQIIYEDEHALGFLDIAPHAPGHTLVIPKNHAPSIVQMHPNDVGPLFVAVKKIAALLEQKLTPEGITIGINQGRASGQEVDHLHVHVMPRWSNDGGGSIQSIVRNVSAQTVEEIKNKILG